MFYLNFNEFIEKPELKKKTFMSTISTHITIITGFG